MAEDAPYTTQAHPAQRGGISGIPGELIDAGFENVAEVGRGGFGIVYRAFQPSLDRTVAVKVLTADLDPDNLDRFLREQRAMGRLSGHPHIVTILEVGTTATGRPFLVMPYHQNDSLEALVRRNGPLDWGEVVRLGVKVAGALEAAHRVGTLHRDVKPGNILISDYGEPQLTDFGIARIAGGFQTSTGVITGSPAFTAPEVLEGAPPTPQSDVYSLGATLFSAITGHAAFERRRGEKVVAQFLRITSQPIPNLREEGLPADVASVIEKAMARDPADRPDSAAAFGEQLRQVQREHGVAVDEMAHPVELGAPRSDLATARSTYGHDTHATPAPPTPATKYRPQVPARSRVSRRRLTDALSAAGRRRLILIYAPSGYGKSTLAAQWREELVRAGVAVAWLTIDDDDNNPVWFLAHLLESIRRVHPKVAESLDHVLEEHGDDGSRYLLTSIIDALHDADEPTTLIVDDWQRVSDSQTIAALSFLLEHGCHHLQIIVTSWSRTGLPLSRLRLADELVEVDSAALRFDSGEATSFFDSLGGLSLTGNDVAALTESTDGWAAGLQLAGLSVRGGADASTLVGKLCGTSEVIGEFLAENVLASLEPEIVDFVLATSIPERICADLASALAQVPRGQALLEQVAQRGLFLQPVDGEPGWFHYHQMFAEFLRRRLERDDPQRVAQLHRTAALWLKEHDRLHDAVKHALAAGDPALAVDFVEDDETNLLEQSKMTTLLEIVKKLPPRLIVSRERLQLAIAWANILLQRKVPADAALNLFTKALDHADPATQADLRVEADVLQAVADTFADRIDRVDTLVAEALSRPQTFHPRVPAVAGNVSAFAALYRFQFDQVRRLLAWATPYREMMGPFVSVYARCYLGLAAKFALDIATALAEFRRAVEIAQSCGTNSNATRIAGAFLGEMLHDVGKLTEAKLLLDESYRLGPEGGGVDYLVARFVAGARVNAAHGDCAAAAERLEAGMAVADQLHLPRLSAAINHERVRLGIGLSPPVSARLRDTRHNSSDDGIVTLTYELDEASAIRLLSASGSEQDRADAHRRARDLLTGIDATLRPWAALRAQLLLAETLRAAGLQPDPESAGLAQRCNELGLVRLAVEAGLT